MDFGSAPQNLVSSLSSLVGRQVVYCFVRYIKTVSTKYTTQSKYKIYYLHLKSYMYTVMYMYYYYFLC